MYHSSVSAHGSYDSSLQLLSNYANGVYPLATWLYTLRLLNMVQQEPLIRSGDHQSELPILYLENQRPSIIGPFSMNYGVLYGIVANCFGLLGFPGSHLVQLAKSPAAWSCLHSLQFFYSPQSITGSSSSCRQRVRTSI